MISNASFLILDETEVLKNNNTGPALLGTTILTVTICTAGILANSLIIIVVLFGSLRNYVIMNLLLALAIIENVYLLTNIEKQRGIFGTDFHSEKWLPRLLFLLEVINHCVNFFLYYITGSVFRTALFEMFKCKNRKSNKQQSHEMMTISETVI